MIPENPSGEAALVGPPEDPLASMVPKHRSGIRSVLPWLSGSIAVLPLAGLVFIIVVLLVEALPAIRVNGASFFTKTAFNLGNSYGSMVTTQGVQHPGGASFGIFGWAMGTLASSLIAGIVAIPVSVLGALAVVYRLPKRASKVVGFTLEVLAGIPSVIVGLWGALTLGPLLAHHVYPWISRNAPDVPVLSFFRGSPGNGEGLATTGLVLSIMIIPIVAATTRDLLRQVPALPQEGAAALGMTDWEVARAVTLPWVAAGIVGAAVLGLARALGETMAVAMVSGVVVSGSPTSFFAPMTTVAATIVTQLDSAFTDSSGFAVKSLAEAALVLALITLVVNVLARLLVRRVSAAGLPVGRGL